MTAPYNGTANAGSSHYTHDQWLSGSYLTRTLPALVLLLVGIRIERMDSRTYWKLEAPVALHSEAAQSCQSLEDLTG